MAIVNSFKFSRDQGGVISDEESWHLRLRKSHHTEHVVELLPGGIMEESGVVALYGGVGGPDFHYEVVHRARVALQARKKAGEPPPRTLEEAGRAAVDMFNRVTRRYTDDRLRFLYGITLDDLNNGRVRKGGEKHDLAQGAVKTRALKMAKQEEGFDDAPLSPPNHACLAGWDAESGFQGFCMKQESGVLSLQAGGFESIGAGKYAGGISFQKLLRGMTLEERREGPGAGRGLLALVSSIIEAGEHFGQVGGNYNLYVVDGGAKDSRSRVKYFHGGDARLAVEIARASRAGFIAESAAERLLLKYAMKGGRRAEIEREMFAAAKNPRGLDLMLRGYKVGPESGDFKTNAFAGK